LIVPGLLSPGDSFSVEFDNPGIISYNCSIHPGMVGTITVQ
jgi:plastocyanin